MLWVVFFFNNGLLIQYGQVKNSPSGNAVNVILPTTYITSYIGITNMGGNSNNGCVTRFNYISNTQFKMGFDAFVGVYLNTTKTWITIGY